MERLRKNKTLFLYYYLIMIPVAVGIWILASHYHLMEENLALMLTAYLLLFSLIFLITNRYSFQIFLFLLTLLTGVYGFEHYAYKDYPLINALYSTFRLFMIDVDNVFTKSGDKFVAYPLSIEIARWSAALYLISTIFQIAYSFFNESIKLFFYKLLGNHYVVVGYHQQSKILLQNLRDQGERVILLTEGLASSEKEYLDELGVMVLVGTKTDHDLYETAGLHRARYGILFHEDDPSNLDELISIRDYFREKRRSGEPLNILLHLTDQQSTILYEEIEKEMSKAEETVVRIVNTHRLIADNLLNAYPLYLHYEEWVKDPSGDALHLLFVGFDETNQQVALKAMERAHFYNKNKLSITVLDKEIEKVKKLWFRTYPKSHHVADFHFRAFDIHAQALEWLFKDGQPFTHVFLSTGDDYLNMMEGIRLSKQLNHLPIFINVKEEGLLSYQVYQKTQELANLYCFGYYHEVLNKEVFINEKQDKLAKLIHERYQEQKRRESPAAANLPSWEQLTDFKRESNRSQFNHALTKLMLLGLDAVPKDEAEKVQGKVLSKEEYLLEISDQLEKLAEVEHRRWNAFHYLRGWDVYPTPTPDKTRDEERKLHGCLVSWEELDRVMELVGENYKKYDRDTIIQLYDMWKTIDYEIVKRESVPTQTE
ncbi:hypothetical protein [Laceyella putida]|uniref:RCK N-terminal domain-containing protein n=1 Tax=Laceyella putida TaxID=110101 RepID=A0ABW2RJU0_9BACL